MKDSTAVENIRLIYGPNIAKELLPVSDKDEHLEFAFDSLVSNANFNIKKMVFLLFINRLYCNLVTYFYTKSVSDRLVESSSMKRALETLYAMYLPKGTHPFVYMSLEIAPEKLDVNVHPTKKEVMFLHEEKIIESICDSVKIKLANANQSRTFVTQ
ncbi:DNA mismatch repair protein, partial [Irineochytrium annulatum]